MTYKLTNTSQPADLYYGAVSVLLDGRAFEDRSVNPKTIGGTFVLDTTESKWNGISYNTGSSGWQYMSVENTGNAFDFGSEDFTIEFWMNTSFMRTNTIYRHVALNFDRGYKPILIQFVGNQLRCYASGSGSAWNVSINSGFTVSLNTWYHVAFVRNGDTFTPYLNGVAGNSATYSGSLMTTTSNLYVGSYPSGTPKDPFTGNFQDVRITKGVARYTSNFTPPTQPFFNNFKTGADQHFYSTSLLLKGDGTNGSTNIVDSSFDPKTITVNGDAQISTAQSKFGGSSLKFDGTGDYLTVPNSPAYAFGTGDFTIECWFYIAGNSPQNASNIRNASLVGATATSGTFQGYGFGILGNTTTTGTALLFENYDGFGNVYTVTYTATITQSTWHHVALVRSGTTTRIYFNGTDVASGTLGNQTISNSTHPLYIGRGDYAGYLNPLNGYIDDLRITKGIARYTSNFTPPGPLPTY